MTQLMHDTINDLRGGRETWRVVGFFCTLAFVIAFTAGLHL
jgi:hypothetical protein